MRDNYWAKITKMVTSVHNIERPWLIRVYPPGEERPNGWLGTSRTRTFEEAITIAHQNIKYEMQQNVR